MTGLSEFKKLLSFSWIAIDSHQAIFGNSDQFAYTCLESTWLDKMVNIVIMCIVWKEVNKSNFV